MLHKENYIRRNNYKRRRKKAKTMAMITDHVVPSVSGPTVAFFDSAGAKPVITNHWRMESKNDYGTTGIELLVLATWNMYNKPTFQLQRFHNKTQNSKWKHQNCFTPECISPVKMLSNLKGLHKKYIFTENT